jgi:predicted DNA-binding transcriptional regulator YafY
VQRKRVRLSYRGWDRDPVERLVDPWGLVETTEVWYLLGGVDGAQRTYWGDRIVEATVSHASAERLADFDLAAAWEDVVQEVNSHRERASAVVIVDRAVVPFLPEQLGARAVSDAPVDDRHARLRVTAPTELVERNG